MAEPASMAIRAAVRAALADLDGTALVLVGVSGGADSLALAAAAAWAAERGGPRAGAVCIDHGLQPGSAAVAETAAHACRSLALDPVTVVTVDVTRTGAGPEAEARVARHAALTTAARDADASAVLLGHTADDQAEQVLLGLLRGSGVRSLAGMPTARDLIRRPLLGISRAQTEESCGELGLTPWRDPHNVDPAYARIRARTALADLTRDLGPGIRAGLLRTAEAARIDADHLDAEATAASEGLGPPPWSVDALAAIPPALRGRIWRAALLRAGAPATDLTADHVAACDRLVTDWHGQGPLHLPGRLRVRRSTAAIVIEPGD